jgi:hypothetical protein
MKKKKALLLGRVLSLSERLAYDPPTLHYRAELGQGYVLWQLEEAAIRQDKDFLGGVTRAPFEFSGRQCPPCRANSIVTWWTLASSILGNKYP